MRDPCGVLLSTVSNTIRVKFKFYRVRECMWKHEHGKVSLLIQNKGIGFLENCGVGSVGVKTR